MDGCGGLGVWPQDFPVIPWHFDNGASRKIDYVIAEDGGLHHFLPLAVHVNFFLDHSGPFLFSEIFCGTPPSCLKVVGGWWWPTGF